MAYFAVDPQSVSAAAPALRTASLDGVDTAAAAAAHAIAASVGGGECAAVAGTLATSLGTVLGELRDQLSIFATLSDASGTAYARVEQLAGGVFGGAQ